MGGKRVARLCRYLPSFGIQPIVLTVQERYYESRDHSFAIGDGIRVERTAVLPTPFDVYRGLKTALSSDGRSFNSIAGTDRPHENEGHTRRPERFSPLRRHIRELLGTPDTNWGWFLPATRAGRRLIEGERIAAIFSSAPSWTPHLIGRNLRKKYPIPWIADFRDAWIGDTWRTPTLPGWRYRVESRLEASCLNWADLVTCVTDYIRDDFARRYRAMPPTKFVTLTNGYDCDSSHRSDPPGTSSVPPLTCDEGRTESTPTAGLEGQTQGSRCLVLHLGDLYGGRRVDAFCQAVQDLVDSGKVNPDSIKILFMGNNDPLIVQAACQRAPALMRSNCIEFRDRVSWQEGQRVLAEANLLLIIQGNHRAVTAKFYEYLPTGKPVLAIVREGPLSAMVRATGAGLSADYEDPAEISARFLEALALPTRSTQEVRSSAGQYDYRNLAKQLAEWIHELAAVRVGGTR